MVLAVVFESRRFPNLRFVLPVLSRLYLNKKSARKWQRNYRKKTDLMIEILTKLEKHIAQSDKTLHSVFGFYGGGGDPAFTAPAILAHLPESIQVTGRIPADARLHEPAPQAQSGRRGQPRVR